jgi:hypothetical protein
MDKKLFNLYSIFGRYTILLNENHLCDTHGINAGSMLAETEDHKQNCTNRYIGEHPIIYAHINTQT